MSIEELLKPRWKVIVTFPDNRNYEVGSVLDRDWCRYVNDEDESEGVIWKISDFPHLFKKLEWWEERKVDDMPEYIKPIRAQQYIFKVYTIVGDIVSFANKNGGFSIDKLLVFLPATKEEYEQQYKNQK